MFLKHSIFIGEELKAPIEKYGDLLWEAQVEHELNLELDDVKPERIKKKKLQQLGKEQLAEAATRYTAISGTPIYRPPTRNRGAFEPAWAHDRDVRYWDFEIAV